MRFAEFRSTKAYDLLAVAPLVAWYVLGIFAQLPNLTAEKIALGMDAENIRAASHVLALLTSFAFLGLITVLLLLRPPPLARASGFLPGAVAFAHSFLTVGYLWIAPSNASIGVNIASWMLSTIGTGAGIAVMLWLGRAFSILPQARRLITGGPYAYVRHPLYLAETIGGFGAMLQFAQPWAGLLFLATMPLMILRMGYEERVLAQTFPDYRDYAARTARLIPGIY